MKAKDRFVLEDDYTSSKKKHTKCHEFANKKKNTHVDEPGLVTDKLGQLINIGDVVQARVKGHKQTVECEVVKVHPGNTLTVIYDDIQTNGVETYEVNAWDVTIIA